MFILIVEMCERLCFYTLYPTFPQYLEHAGPMGHGMEQGPANALKQSFRMLAYLFPIVGGYLADNIFGRYRTILYFTICYVIGVAMIAVGSIEQLMTIALGKIIFMIGAFVFTAIGTGAIKPNVVNFGAEQYDENDPEEAEQQKAFFSYFYMTINIGSVFASVWIAGLATSTTTSSGPGQGYFYAYTVAAVAMAISLTAFVVGTPRYSPESKAIPTKKPMVSIIKKHLFAGAATSWQGKLSLLGWIFIPVYLAVNLTNSLIPSDKLPSAFSSNCDADGNCVVPGMSVLALVAMIMAIISSGALIVAHKNNDWIPAMEDARVGAITTEEVRGFMRALPTIICVTIGFNICYGGMDIYQIQACQMDTRTGFPKWLDSFFFLKGQFNGVFFSLGDNASIIVCIPLMESVIFPALKSMRRGKPVSRMMKYDAGFFFCILACVIGIILEYFRKNADHIMCDELSGPNCFCAIDGNAIPAKQISTRVACLANNDAEWLLVSQCAPPGVAMSTISAWWTFIPYWVTGMGEILVNPVIQEFAFDEVSSNLKSLLMGVTLVVMGCVPGVIEGTLTGFIPNDLNKGNVDVVFILFIVLSLILLGLYHMIAIPDKVRTVGQSPSLLDVES
jgi:dipeptide/tripeptide permease